VVPGGLEDAECAVATVLIVLGEERQSDRETRWHGWSGNACGTAGTVGLGGDLVAHGREGIGARGIVHMGQECRTVVRQRHTAPEQGTSRAPLGGRDLGVWVHTAAPALGNRWGIALGMCGLPAVEGLHRQRRTEDAREARVRPQVSEPVPGAHARDGHDEPLAIRGKSFQEGLRGGWHGAVHKRRAALVEATDQHGTGVQVDATVQGVLGRAESP
jgi:hypothetical protein